MASVNTLGALTHRNILKSLRNPDIVVFATVAPVAFALLFAFVFGSAMEMNGSAYREYLLVGILAQTMLMTSTNTGIGLAMDNKQGMMDRFRSLPVRPVAVVTARANSDLAMNLIVIVLLTLVGLAMGWRIRTGPLEAAAGFGLLLLFAYALSWVSAWIGLKVRSPEVLSNVSMLILLPLAFISTAFVPTEGMPAPLRIAAEWNPVSAVVTGVRELFGNVPDAAPITYVLPLQYPVFAGVVWSLLLLLIFVPLATRSYVNSHIR